MSTRPYRIVLAALVLLAASGPAVLWPSGLRAQTSDPAGASALPLRSTIEPPGQASKPAAPWGGAGTVVVPAPSPPSPLVIPPGKAAVTLSAQLTQDGEPIDLGLIWRVFRPPVAAPSGQVGQPILVGLWRDPVPVVALDPGEYVVNVGYGRAHLTRKIAIEAPTPREERFVLNAGGLRVSCHLAGGEKPSPNAVSYDIYAGDADQLGGRVRLVAGLKPGAIVRLNAGLYHVTATLGDANAVVNADVTVEAGKLTDAVLSYNAARVTFKLVTRAGGEAQADTQWAVHTMQGELVRESQGALPTHILAAGHYIASARHGGRLYQSQFEIKPGEPAQVEVVMH